MITKFSTVYAGHVDLGDMGQEATPANERRYSNEHLASVFEKTEAIARCMDEHGYHTLWLAEHHFQHEGYEVIPNILMAAVHLAHLTSRLRIGCGFNITPMWHPLRLAEDFATADILTRGRTVFGVGRGYHTREVETFGAPMLDAEANRDLFEEQVDIIMKAFALGVVLAPGQALHAAAGRALPRLRAEGAHAGAAARPPAGGDLAAGGERGARGLDFMHKHRIKGLIGGGAATMAEKSIYAYQEAAQRAGLDWKLGEGLSLGIFYHLADSRERGRPRDHAVVRGAREDVRAAGLRARHHPRAARRLHAARRLGRRRRAHRRGLHEGGRLVRGAARGAGGLSPLARGSASPASSTCTSPTAWARPRR